MDYQKLGPSGLLISRLSLGTMNFGVRTDEKEAFRIMDAALEQGINLFDTADMYGRPNFGKTEEIIGKWFALGGGRRDRVILATKIYNDMGDELDGPNAVGFNAWRVRRHLEDCLRRLGTDRIDILYMHEYDAGTSWAEIWSTFSQFQNSGKVLYAAGSNFADRHVWRAQSEAARRGIQGLTVLQEKYNLINRGIEMELVPSICELNLGLMAWSPLCGGLLSGKVLGSSDGRRTTERIREGERRYQAKVEAYSQLCRENGLKEAEAATAWLLSRPYLTSVLIGPRTVDQLADTCKAIDCSLSEEFLRRLEEIFPGPGTAPRGYL